MPQAVRFDRYGGIDVLQVVQVERPVPGPGQVLVRVKAAGVNPGEAAIRQGAMAPRWPATFPLGRAAISLASSPRSVREWKVLLWAMR